MKSKCPVAVGLLGLLIFLSYSPDLEAGSVEGWLHWRGPDQNGTTQETGLPDQLELDQPVHLWTVPLSGRSSPVIANGVLYTLGYAGDGPDLQEVLAAFDAETGAPLWEHRFNDFLSDVIYNRYSSSNPTVDAETGHVYMQGTQGILACFTAKGENVWKVSMMESYGRMTFPNGRTTTPVVDGDLVITHGITSNWGRDGPGADRFYAFDKKSGELVWASTPGEQPRDSSYAPPFFGWWNGKRVFYCGTGDGSVVCVNARTGDPIWRVKISQGGINAAVLVHNNDKIIAVHGRENIDSATVGRMTALRIPKELPETDSGQVVFNLPDLEIWRNPISAFSNSPILVGDMIYQVGETGTLNAVDVETGTIVWREKVGNEPGNASMLYSEGKLYLPMLEDPEPKGAGAGSMGAFYVIRPGQNGGEIVSKVQLEGLCFGSPAIWNGKIYLHTARNLYAFGKKGNNPGTPQARPAERQPAAGPKARLQIIPAEVDLRPGESASFRVRALDASGFLVEEVKDLSAVKWASFIPATARVRSRMDAEFNAKGELVAGPDAISSAGSFEASLGDLKGYIRGRVLPGLPFEENFDSFELAETHPLEQEAFAYPPLPWIGARFRFDVRERDGSQVLAKTIDDRRFQRGTIFFGAPEMKNYTVEADVKTDGDRRRRSDAGLVNQRYLVVLKGNARQLEVNSNQERVRVSVPFPWEPNQWYRLKSRVDVAEDGSGVVRAKAWKRGEPEPEAWTIEVPHRNAHKNGSPGLFGFAPQEMRVYIDNVSVTQN